MCKMCADVMCARRGQNVCKTRDMQMCDMQIHADVCKMAYNSWCGLEQWVGGGEQCLGGVAQNTPMLHVN